MIIVVCGATASYKTRLSVDLAKKYNGIVVSKTVLSEDIYSALDRIIKTGKENSEVISTSGILIDKEQLNELYPELLNNIKELN